MKYIYIYSLIGKICLDVNSDYHAFQLSTDKFCVLLGGQWSAMWIWNVEDVVRDCTATCVISKKAMDPNLTLTERSIPTKRQTLVGGLGHFLFFQYIGNVIIPTDFNSIIFPRGGEKNTNQDNLMSLTDVKINSLEKCSFNCSHNCHKPLFLIDAGTGIVDRGGYKYALACGDGYVRIVEAWWRVMFWWRERAATQCFTGYLSNTAKQDQRLQWLMQQSNLDLDKPAKPFFV